MGKEIEIHAYHGWGFDSSIWSEWKSILPKEIVFKTADRGYFGSPFIPEFNNNSIKTVVFAHSFGLHCIDDQTIQEADVLVILNGFDSFHPTDWKEKKRSKKILKAMMKQFKADPDSVLKTFYKNCFHPQKKEVHVPEWMNKSLLYTDLKLLHKSSFQSKIKKGCEVIVLEAGEDRIVEGNREGELSDKLPVSDSYSFNQFGHGLPFVNTGECWSYLCEVIPIFRQYEHSS